MTAAPVRRALKRAARRPRDSRASPRGARRRSCRAASPRAGVARAWLPTFAAVAGEPGIKQKLAAGTTLGGRQYRNYIDGYDQLAYLAGKADQSPRNEFFYVNDDGQVVAIRYGNWKSVFLENRGEAFEVWREPFTELRVPLLFNLRRDPFERAQHNATVYSDWFLDHASVAVPRQQLAARFLMTMKEYPPSQSPGSFNLDKVQKQIEAAARGR